jgi:hypothetical protein
VALGPKAPRPLPAARQIEAGGALAAASNPLLLLAKHSANLFDNQWNQSRRKNQAKAESRNAEETVYEGLLLPDGSEDITTQYGNSYHPAARSLFWFSKVLLCFTLSCNVLTLRRKVIISKSYHISKKML